MASLFRIAANQCRSLGTHLVKKEVLLQPRCLISTSKKNKDASAATIEPRTEQTASETAAKEKEDFDPNWISYGYVLTDPHEDKWHHRIVMFMGVTLCLVTGSFVAAYMPDHRMRDWSQREAFLVLAHREANGLPLIDPELVPRDQIELPSEEELGDVPIII
ncbi:unnamed protein product [Owenia fusiformis]|uniref:NADH dehydrogenase [ubiquinone] 1 beta subcomplex subunit 11, mitochondrial n=1 Tax=Owenia fusiformis TaxID=6347 RepID=A0A8J1XH06_OWEFU|nr:unnamed protein product [Owenia fusiformis]